MLRFFGLFFLTASALAFHSEDFSLPEYDQIFLEQFDRDVTAVSHTEDSFTHHSEINGQFANDSHKMHMVLGPNYGLLLRFSQADSSLNGNDWAEYQMPGFSWKTQFSGNNVDLSQQDANIRIHSRQFLRLSGLKIVPYTGIDYLSMQEKLTNNDEQTRDTKLFYLPVGMAISKDNMVLHLALSGMVWGDVKVNNLQPKVDKGYGLLVGFLWHKSSKANCHLDWNLMSYNVSKDNFVLSKKAKGDIANKLSAWNAKCALTV